MKLLEQKERKPEDRLEVHVSAQGNELSHQINLLEHLFIKRMNKMHIPRQSNA